MTPADDATRREHAALLEEYIAIIQSLSDRGLFMGLPEAFRARCIAPPDTLVEARYRVEFLRGFKNADGGGLIALHRIAREWFDADIPFLERIERIDRDFPPVVARVRGDAGLSAVSVNGSRALGRELGYFETGLHDGTVGYFQRRADDCLQAAIASCLQVSPHLVPDLRIFELIAAGKELGEIERATWEKMRRWAERNAVTVMVHPVLPTAERRWIGVSAQGAGHCLLMSRRNCLFDPASPLPPEDHAWHSADSSDIEYGITIERR